MGRRLALLVATGALALGLVAATPAATSAPGALPVGVSTWGASLAPGGEVPKPTAPAGAGGLFSSILTSDGTTATLAWSLDVSGLSGAATGAHIHVGAPGTAGPIAIELCGPCAAGARGRVTLDAKTADAISAGEAYVNVHTKANAGGEIRGQLAPAHGVAAGLGSSGEVPPAQSVPTDAKGAFEAIVIDLPKRAVLAWTLTQSGLSGPAQAAHIHIGARGTAGPIALGLCSPCTGSQSGRREIKPALAAAIAGGSTYVNVHTTANAAGEIRGQVLHATLGVAIRTTPLGTIVTDDRGWTLYTFAADKGTQSACYGQCAVFWPPSLLVGSPVAGGGTQASLLATAARTDGTTMLTYNGQPLYGFLPDVQPGDTKGQGSRGFGAPWLVIDPASGKAIGG